MTARGELLDFLQDLPQMETREKRAALLTRTGFNRVRSAVDGQGSAEDYSLRLVDALSNRGRQELLDFLEQLSSGTSGLAPERQRPAAEIRACIAALDEQAWLDEFVVAVRTALEKGPCQPGRKEPYLGLKFYDVEDWPRYYGRERTISTLVALVRESAFVAILGPSGSGKSSLARAGLISTLKGIRVDKSGKELRLADKGLPPVGSKGWNYFTMRPGKHPLEALAKELTKDASPACEDLLSGLRERPGKLREWAEKTGPHVLLLVDQFEELFTLYKKVEQPAEPGQPAPVDEADLFVRALVSACDGPVTDTKRPPCTVIITLRDDFYAEAMKSALAERMPNHIQNVREMSEPELREMITQPAADGEWGFETGLVDKILEDVAGQPGKLPLLSYALSKTWDNRSGRVMTHAGYHAAGGVDKAIGRIGESVLNNLLDPKQGGDEKLKPVVHSAWFKLVDVVSEGRAWRRRAKQKDLAPNWPKDSPETRVLLTFSGEAARLVTGVDSDGQGEAAREGEVELSHDALLTEWTALATWIETRKADIIQKGALQRKADEWQQAQRDGDRLLRGGALAQAIELRDKLGNDLEEDVREFVIESERFRNAQVAAEAKRSQRERKTQRKLFLATVAIAGILLVAVVVVALLAIGANVARATAVNSEMTAVAARSTAEAANKSLYGFICDRQQNFPLSHEFEGDITGHQDGRPVFTFRATKDLGPAVTAVSYYLCDPSLAVSLVGAKNDFSAPYLGRDDNSCFNYVVAKIQEGDEGTPGTTRLVAFNGCNPNKDADITCVKNNNCTSTPQPPAGTPSGG